MGNKGGVGISLKLAGSTFLFLNAHLAGATVHCLNHAIYLIYTIVAHEGKINHRVANLSKIKVGWGSSLTIPVV